MKSKIKNYQLKLALALIGASFWGVSQAATHSIVCTGTGDGGLQAAITDAANGDTINIQGTCVGNYLIIQDVTLQQDPTVGALPAVLDGGLNGPVISMSLGTLVMSGLTIQHGSSVIGSAMVVNGGTFTLDKSYVINNGNNNAATGGPTIQVANTTSNPTITHTTFSGNASNYGAVISAEALNMSDCTITNNTAVNDIFGLGGGSLVHNTIVNNTSSQFTTLAIRTGLNLAGNIIANNTTLYGDVYSGSDAVISGGYNIFGQLNPTYSGGFVTQPTDIIGASPNLGPLQNNGGPTSTMMPLSGSPAIAVIPIGNTLCPSTAVVDQRGAPVPGIGKTACDLGAYETGAPQMTVTLPISGILNFGTVTGLTSGLVSVMNTGNSTVPAPQTGVISGAQASKFTLPTAANFSNAIPILASQSYTVNYKPTTNSTDSASLAISATGTKTVNVGLTGTGSGFVPPPIQEIATIITYVDQAVANKKLVGTPPSSSRNLNEFERLLTVASQDIQFNYINGACIELLDAANASKSTQLQNNLIQDAPHTSGATAATHAQIEALITNYCPVR